MATRAPAAAPEQRLRFERFTVEDGLSNSEIMFILQDSDGSLWGGTLGFGLEKFNPQDNVAVHYQHDPDDPNSLGEDTICDLHRDPQDRIWIGTVRGGLSIFEPTENQFKNYPPDPDDPKAISNASVYVIYQTDDGVAWLGAMGGG